MASAVGAAIIVAFLASPEFVRPYWPSVAAVFGDESVRNYNGYVWGIWIVHVSTLILGNLFWYMLYRHEYTEYRLEPEQPWPWKHPDAAVRQEFAARVKQSILLTFVNSTLITVPLTMFNWTLNPHNSFTMDAASFPTVQRFAQDIFLCMLVEDTGFYWAHRLLHHPRLYKHIHKLHHDYKHSVSIAVQHLHPIEFLVANAVMVGLGPMLIGAHAYTTAAWVAMRILQTQEAHSGYALPWSPWRWLPLNPAGTAHEAHHSLNTGNYGSFFGYWDDLCGTRIKLDAMAAPVEASEKAAAVSTSTSSSARGSSRSSSCSNSGRSSSASRRKTSVSKRTTNARK